MQSANPADVGASAGDADCKDLATFETIIDQWFKLVKVKTFLHKSPAAGERFYYLTDDSGSESDEDDEKQCRYRAKRVKHEKQTENIDVAIKNLRLISQASQRVRSIVAQKQYHWLHLSMKRHQRNVLRHANGDYDDDDKLLESTLVRLLRCIGSLYKYCQNWAYVKYLYCPYDRRVVKLPTDEAIEAFRQLYEDTSQLQKTLLEYILSANFGRDIAVKSTKKSNELIEVFEQFTVILCVIQSFDLRGSADLWKCCVKLCSDFTAQLQQSDGKVLGQILSVLIRRVTEIEMQVEEDGEADRNKKLAIFHAKVLLRLCQLFRNALSVNLFKEFAVLLVSLKQKLKPQDNEQDGILFGLFQDMLPFMYAKGAKSCLTNFTDPTLCVELNVNILNLLMIETDIEIILAYAKRAFLLEDFSVLLNEIALRNEANDTADHYRSVVVRITALIVLVSHRHPDLVPIIDTALQSALHTNHYFNGLLCYDVWLMRLALMSLDQCLAYALNMWLQNVNSSVFGYRTANVFARRLLAAFYDRLPTELQAEFLTAIISKSEKDQHDWCSNRTEGLPSTQTDVWSVLRTRRVADPEMRAQHEQTITDNFVKAAGKFDVIADDGVRRPIYDIREDDYYALERIRHAAYGIHNDRTATLLDQVCSRLHPKLPVVFAAELDYVLHMLEHLTADSVRHTLDTLGEHFAERDRTSNVDQHPDDLIRLVCVDLLCRLATGSRDLDDCAQQQMARLLDRLLNDGGDVVVQANCWRRFVDCGPRIRHPGVLMRVFKLGERTKLDVARVLRKEPLPALPSMGRATHRLMRPEKYEHICKGRFGNLTPTRIAQTVQTMDDCVKQIERLRQYSLIAEWSGWLEMIQKELDHALSFRKSYMSEW